MENADIAQVLSEIADILELTGGNPFKVRAYRQAAGVVDTLPGPISELWRKGELTQLPAIGAHIAERIGELLQTGTCREHERLLRSVPPGVLEMLRVEGVGPRMVAAVWKGLGITNLDALEEGCKSERICDLPRMGPARARAILAAIGRYRARLGRTPLHRAVFYAETLVNRLRQVPGVVQAEAAGSVRRRKETVGDLDLLAAAEDAEAPLRALAGMPEVAAVLGRGPTKCSVRLRVGLQVDLRAVPPDAFGAALHYFTGSKAHNIEIRTRAMRLGIKLNEYGVFDREGRRLGGAQEEDVFRAMGMPWIPPELREGAGEIEAALEGRLPRLVEEEDILGDLHVHTTASSDGRADLAEMAEEAARLGRRYLAITDHSRSRPLGLDAARLAAQAAEVRALDRRLRGRPLLLTGIEVDILPDGTFDLPLESLAALDIVVASVHTHFAEPAEMTTARLVRALRSGVVHVLGHPSGRLLGRRDPSPFDLERVLVAARELGVAMEVNAQPDRLDLSDKGCRLAKEAGVPVVISTDAHNTQQLANLRYGVWVARRGWLTRDDVLNTLPPEALLERTRRPRGRPRTRPGAEPAHP